MQENLCDFLKGPTHTRSHSHMAIMMMTKIDIAFERRQSNLKIHTTNNSEIQVF